MVATCVSQADALGVAMAVAVCDAGGHLVAFSRMDEASILAGDTAPAKARMAVVLRRPTAGTVELAASHPHVYASFVAASSAPVVLSMGGEPLWDDGVLVGGVGASGGSGRQDIEVVGAALDLWAEHATAGASAVSDPLRPPSDGPPTDRG